MALSVIPQFVCTVADITEDDVLVVAGTILRVVEADGTSLLCESSALGVMVLLDDGDWKKC